MNLTRGSLLVILNLSLLLVAACHDDTRRTATPAPLLAATGQSAAIAAGGPPQVALSLQPSAVEVTAGGTVTVELRAALAPGVELGAWTFELSYDAARLQATECTAISSSGASLCNPTPVSGPPRVTTTGASTAG